MRRKRGETDSFSVSFLDVAACGFGAMIILLMITKSGEPISIELVDVPPEGAITELQEQLFAIRGETTILNRDLNAKQEQLSAMKDRIARLQRDLSDVQGRYQTSNQLSSEITDEMGRLAIAQQSMTEEMQRLLANSIAPENNAIGGVPVDSEYIIFVIDTSGSMRSAWRKMLGVIEDTLSVYPEVKGIQVMNSEGAHMFNSYAGQWMEDSPERRNIITNTLSTWFPTSFSNPVPGVTQAINTYYSPDKKISIYYIGDDFPKGYSVSEALKTIDLLNKEDENGDRLVRIHAIGFPVIFTSLGGRNVRRDLKRSVYGFSNLMREMTQRNGGTFVGLNDFQ